MKKTPMSKNILVSYIRDKKNNLRGVLVAAKRREDGSVSINYSYCRKCDKFSKEIGLKIAMGRALIDYENNIVCPREVYKMLDRFKARAEKYFKVKINGNFSPYLAKIN